MKTLRDYEKIIRLTVKKINDEDPNWDFSVKDITDYRVWINWTYLDYCEEKDNCFFLYLHNPIDEKDDPFLTCRTPQDEMIDGYFVEENHDTGHSWVDTYEHALLAAIYEIADYAHSRY